MNIDNDFRQSYLSMLDVLCETFGFELFDYQKSILLERMVFEKKIAEKEKEYLDLGTIVVRGKEKIDEDREHC